MTGRSEEREQEQGFVQGRIREAADGLAGRRKPPEGSGGADTRSEPAEGGSGQQGAPGEEDRG